MKSTTENIKPHLNTSKWIKLLVGLLLIVVVTVGSLFVLGFLLEEKVKSVIITEINKKGSQKPLIKFNSLFFSS